MKKLAVISLSGGLDSTTVLLKLLTEGYTITATSFNYGQKHLVEIEKAQELVNYLQQKGYSICYQQISLSGLSDLLHSTLISGGDDIPKGHYQEASMKLTVVPNRNKIFSSIIQAIALSLANQHNIQVKIALGIHAGDHAIYPDCRQAFRDADYQAFLTGNWDAQNVSYYTPYIDTDKAGILADGINCCQTLNLNSDEVYKRTLTSYQPINFNGIWYSDYESSSSIERIEAFILNDLTDPLQYANSNGPVKWEVVKKHVKDILKNK